MKTMQKGFTLIELMIVIAIIGILAAVAIPQYQSYIARSEVQTSLQSLRGPQVAIEDYYQRFGTLPADAATLKNYNGTDLSDASYTTYPKYSVTYTLNAGTILVTFGSSPDVSKLIEGGKYTIQAYGDADAATPAALVPGTDLEIEWGISTSGTTLSGAYLPKLK